MIKGLYTAAAGMLSTMIQTDTLANNLANVNTSGFKKNGVNFQSFPELLMKKMDKRGAQDIGSMMTGSKVRSTAVNFDQGGIRQTGNSLDVAIQGDGFFTVQDGQGNTFYTRNGSFTLSREGILSTLDGKAVVGEGGTIYIPPDATDLKITEEGLIASGTQIFGRLKVTRFVDNGVLEKVGDTTFQPSDPGAILDEPGVDEALGYKLFQGSIETSNVNVVAELVNNISGMRLYESLQKNIQMHNQTLGKAVNEVGRYR